MQKTCKNQPALMLIPCLLVLALVIPGQPALAANETGFLDPVWPVLDFIKNIITIAALGISDFYFSYIHGTVVGIITAVWPETWPDYPAMLGAYQNFFYAIPLWFTGVFWPSSWFGTFPLWGIDLFILTEVFYIALRLVQRKSAPFQGSFWIRFIKNMAYEFWVFFKAPFFALASVLLFLFRPEKEKRRTLLFWLYTVIFLAILVGIVAWLANLN